MRTISLSWSRYPYLLLLAVGLAIFLPASGFEFLNIDDDVNIYQNPYVLDWSFVNLRLFWQGPYKGLYIPITYNLWSLQALVSQWLPSAPEAGLSPFLFHATNILLHLASSLLLASLFRRLLGNTWGACLGALFFAIHPVQVEPVAWITGFKDLLSGFFSLLALWHYVRFDQPKDSSNNKYTHYVLATCWLVAALLSKPGAVALPLLAGVIGRLLLHRSWRQLGTEIGPWLALGLLAAILTKQAQPERIDDFIPALWQRFLVAGDALLFYAAKAMAPLTLAADYGRSPATILAQRGVKIAALLPYLLLPLLWWKAGRPGRIVLAIFLAAILPVLGFVPFHFQAISTVADRYLYLAMIGPAYGFGWLFTTYRQRTVRVILLAGLSLLIIQSLNQIGYWHDPMTLNSHTLLANPKSWLAYLHRGLAQAAANDHPAAIQDFKKALEFNPSDAKAYNYLGISYAAGGQEQEAEKQFNQAIALNPSLASAYYNLGLLHARTGKPEEALEFYREALLLDPAVAGIDRATKNNPLLDLAQREVAALSGDYRQPATHDPNVGGAAHRNAHQLPLQTIIDKALAYENRGRFVQAIAMYKQAIRIEHDLVEAYNNLGVIYRKRNMVADAEHFYKKAIFLNPDFAEAHNNLGDLYLTIKREKDAIPLFLQAIQILGAHPVPWNNLGKAYAATGNQESSLLAFKKAISLDPNFAEAYNNLSILYLKTKKFALALDYGHQAKNLGFVDPVHATALREYQERGE